MKKESRSIFYLFICVLLWVIFFTTKTVFVTLTLTTNHIRVKSPRDLYNREYEATTVTLTVIDLLSTDNLTVLKNDNPVVLENLNPKENSLSEKSEESYVNNSMIINNAINHNTMKLTSTDLIYKMANVTIGEAVDILITSWPVVRCDLNSSVILVMVHNAAMYTERRKLIRETYGTVDKLSDSRVLVMFMLGKVDNVSLQAIVDQEAAMYNDIVQGSFTETYHNLAYKHVMTLKWTIQLQTCVKVKAVIKVDDDVFINMYQLDRFMRDIYVKDSSKRKYLYCNIFPDSRPYRRKSSKWYISHQDMPTWQWPVFCQGFAYITSPDVAGLLYRASPFTKLVWLDDVYVTGYLAREAKITHTQMKHPYGKFSPKSKPNTGIFMLDGNINKTRPFWRNLTLDHHKMIYEKDWAAT